MILQVILGGSPVITKMTLHAANLLLEYPVTPGPRSLVSPQLEVGGERFSTGLTLMLVPLILSIQFTSLPRFPEGGRMRGRVHHWKLWPRGCVGLVISTGVGSEGGRVCHPLVVTAGKGGCRMLQGQQSLAFVRRAILSMFTFTVSRAFLDIGPSIIILNSTI